MMKPIAVGQLSDNFFETISKEWMLVTAGNKDAFNTMTANWGGIGFLWNKPVVYVFIRPERYTFGFMEKSDYFTLSFLGEENKSIHKICGSKSGREVDKIKETGLKPMITDKGMCCGKKIFWIRLCMNNGILHMEVCIMCMWQRLQVHG